MLKILVDGQEARLVVYEPKKGLRIMGQHCMVDPNSHDITVVWEFDPKAYTDNAQIQHKFTHEGVITTGVADDVCVDISTRRWEQLSEDAGFE